MAGLDGKYLTLMGAGLLLTLQMHEDNVLMKLLFYEKFTCRIRSNPLLNETLHVHKILYPMLIYIYIHLYSF